LNNKNEKIENETSGLTEKLVKLSRVAKVVKGGRRFSFSALMVVGDKEGTVGVGFGKANEVPEAIRKGVEDAKKSMVKVNLKRHTIPHEIIGRYGTVGVIMKPASPGTGIIAGGAVRSVVELAGIKDILTKVQGSRNSLNIVKAAFQGLKDIKNFNVEAEKRNKTIEDLFK
jgi:small subunit ribosomal protein S5